MRLFKQLELTFTGRGVALEGGTRSPSALVGSSRCDDRGRRNAPTPPFLTSVRAGLALSERPIYLRRRDETLESQARELLRSLGADKLAREVRVEWNPRMRTAAGRADFREKLIWLNPLLLDLHAGAHVLARTQFDTRELECKMHSSLTTTTAGITRKSEHQIVVHDEADRTLRHELAHLLAQWRVGRRRIAPHGPEWRQACCDLGIADEARCHNLPFATKTYAARYVYVCPNCKEKFSRVRRIRRAVACLACCRAHNRGEFDARFRLRLVR